MNEKKIEERAILELFLDLYTDAPKGKIKKSEAPDFLFKLSRKKVVGIELSNITHRKAPSEIYDFIDQLNRFFEYRFSLKTSGHIRFAKKIEHSDLNQLNKLVRTISRQTNLKKIIELLSENELIREVYKMDNNPDFKREWSFCNDHFDHQNSLELIDHSVQVKNEKLNAYLKKRLNEYWLLLHVDCQYCLGKSNLYKLIDRINIETNFDRVFVLSIFNKKLYDLS